MPLFAFECADCQTQAELLVARAENALCPSCGSAAFTKLPSVFAPRSGPLPPDAAPMSCGASSCCMGQGGCALN